MLESLHGIPVSSGIAFGRAYKLFKPDLSYEKQKTQNNQVEINKFHQALAETKRELTQIRMKVAQEQREENASIFDAHILILNDPELIKSVEDKINSENINVESALNDTTDFFVRLFEQMDNEYMRERATDIKDVTKRILSHLLGITLPDLSLISQNSIIIADDLSPSDAAQMNKQFVKGFVTDVGSRTSHVAIMARSLAIPAIAGTKKVSAVVNENDYLILDGLSGEVIINPTEEIIQKYIEKNKTFQSKKAKWALLKDKPTVTIDRKQVELVANIGSPYDIESVQQNGAEGIGLYRTEFLYMEGTSLPSENELFDAYKSVLEGMNDKPVVVRTLDIGGDKQLPYWKLPEETNPFLGLRAVRLALREGDIFRTQLKALLRASPLGNLKIMFPMIATLDEFREAKKVLLEEKNKLIAENVEVSDDIEIGIMVEIPSTAILADKFAKEVDFFSIGTNDLIQYTFAADRMNEDVAYLYQPYHPAILRLVKLVIDAAHKEGKWTGMCGEMAGDTHAIPLLLGLGLDEFSMSASSILQARSQIRQLNKTKMTKLVDKALELHTAEEVKQLVDTMI